MREVLPELMAWWDKGETVGVGTVVATFQSAPRPAGASMLVGPDESAVASVSGGCVEGAVYELGQSVVESGTPVLQRYGISDDDAFAVGLKLAGQIRKDNALKDIIKQRYASWDTGIGAKVEAGAAKFEELESYMLEKGDAAPNSSGRQEMLENLINRYVR